MMCPQTSFSRYYAGQIVRPPWPQAQVLLLSTYERSTFMTLPAPHIFGGVLTATSKAQLNSKKDEELELAGSSGASQPFLYICH